MTLLTRRDLLLATSAGALSTCLPRQLFGEDPTDPYADAVLVDGEPRQVAKDSFTIVVLPDTQNYSEHFPELFLAQSRWIVENREKRNIACVLHLGDVTNHNTSQEWENAVRAMDLLHGQVPYFMVPGNHDYSAQGNCQDRDCGLSAAFPIERFQDSTNFGGVYDREPDRTENSFHLFSSGGRDFLSLCLEFGPRKDVVRWANDIVAQHSQRAVILTTHAYIYYDDSRYNWAENGEAQTWNPHSYLVAKNTNDDVSDGEELWNNLVSRHGNFILTLNGHVLGDGLGRMASKTPRGREVPQLLVNFQMRPQGGDGWLRLLEFHSDGKTVDVRDYSPTRNQGNESPQNTFRLIVPAVAA